MPYNARLTYASTSTSKPGTIRQDLLDILAEATTHNSANDINGVLYYGNDYFFQCIEGRKTQVVELFNKICNDPRHTNVVVLSYHEIQDFSFKAWEMKFARQDEQIQQFFSSNQWEVFNPYSLEEGVIDDFLDILILKENMQVEPPQRRGSPKSKFSPLTIAAIVFVCTCLVLASISVYALFHR